MVEQGCGKREAGGSFLALRACCLSERLAWSKSAYLAPALNKIAKAAGPPLVIEAPVNLVQVGTKAAIK